MGDLTPLAWFLLLGAIVSGLLFVLLSDDEVWENDDEEQTLDTRGPDDR